MTIVDLLGILALGRYLIIDAEVQIDVERRLVTHRTAGNPTHRTRLISYLEALDALVQPRADPISSHRVRLGT